MLSDTQLNPAGKVLLGCCDHIWWFSGPVRWFLPHGSKIIQPSVELRPVGLVVGEGVLGLVRLLLKWLLLITPLPRRYRRIARRHAVFFPSPITSARVPGVAIKADHAVASNGRLYLHLLLACLHGGGRDAPHFSASFLRNFTSRR